MLGSPNQPVQRAACITGDDQSQLRPGHAKRYEAPSGVGEGGHRCHQKGNDEHRVGQLQHRRCRAERNAGTSHRPLLLPAPVRGRPLCVPIPAARTDQTDHGVRLRGTAIRVYARRKTAPPGRQQVRTAPARTDRQPSPSPKAVSVAAYSPGSGRPGRFSTLRAFRQQAGRRGRRPVSVLAISAPNHPRDRRRTDRFRGRAMFLPAAERQVTDLERRLGGTGHQPVANQRQARDMREQPASAEPR